MMVNIDCGWSAALASHKASVETVQGNQWKRAGKLYSPRLSALWSWHRRMSLCGCWSLGCRVMNMLPTSQTPTPLFSPCRRYMKHKRDDSAEKQDEETVDVTPIMICVFVVMCCSMLVLLYFFYDHLGTTPDTHMPLTKCSHNNTQCSDPPQRYWFKIKGEKFVAGSTSLWPEH